MVNYKTRQLIDAFDNRVDIDLIKGTIFEGEFSRKSVFHVAVGYLKARKIRTLASKSLAYIKNLLATKSPYMFIAFLASILKGFRSDYHTGPGKVVLKNHHFITHTLISYVYMSFGRIFYSRISRPNLPKEKFVYMALHMEPEAVLVNSSLNQQIYLAEMIASALPAGWRLVVKEHPHQFKLSMSHMYYFLVNLPLLKWFAGYKRLISLENVCILSVSVDSKTVLNRASAVFTVAGSVALEAAVEGVPAMCPKGSFYIGLSPGIQEVSSRDDIKDFLSSLDYRSVSEQENSYGSLAFQKMVLNDEGRSGIEIISRSLYRELGV